METIQQAVIINTKEQILMLKCGKAFGKELAGKWEFPNCFLESNESPEKDLKNEVKTLTGIDIDIIYQFFSSMIKEGENEFLNVAFLCRQKGKAKVKPHKDYDKAKWVKIKDVKKLKVSNEQVHEMAEKTLQAMGGI